jgi:diguanylate cyclase (GGDEF)-like protein
VVRVAQALARATEQAGACCAVAHELCQLAGTSAVAVYLFGGAPEGELRLAAHAGDGLREGWSSQLTFPRRAGRAGRPTPATRVDRHQLASIGVASRSVVAIPLACKDERLGVLVVAGEDVLPPEQTVITTVADLASSTLSTLRRLAESAEEARRDALTGLPNKRAFRELLSSTRAAGQAADSSVSLVAFDIDNFKRINDTQGHPAGDRVLRQVARVTLRALRAGEEAFRVGGEEFAIVVPESLEVAVGVAERIRRALADATRDVLPTISAGVASIGLGSGNVDELIASADAALYEAKRGGKNRVVAAGDVLEQPRIERGRERPTRGLRSVALLELADVAYAWLLAEKTPSPQAALVGGCHHVVQTTGSAGASVSLAVGRLLVSQAYWPETPGGSGAITFEGVLTHAAQAPQAGAPRVVRVAAAGYQDIDLRGLREFGLASVLLLGVRSGRSTIGVVEVYARELDAFEPDQVQRASLGARGLSALLVQRAHGDALRDRYRSSALSLAAALSENASALEQLDQLGSLCRAIASSCGVEAERAFACELAGVLAGAAGGDRRLGRKFATGLGGGRVETTTDLEDDRVGALRDTAALVETVVGTGASNSVGHLRLEAGIVETVLAYRAALLRHRADSEPRVRAVMELVESARSQQAKQVVGALVQVVRGAGQ